MSARSSIALLAALAIAVSAMVPAIGTANRGGPARGVISGWIIYAGGPQRPLKARREPGTVIIRNGHRIILKLHATQQHGFHVSLPFGIYWLNAVLKGSVGPVVHEGCPAETKVTLVPGRHSVSVSLYVACSVP
jgi:hypothetical protein